ncbi:hypothetical protein DINM_001381 [Dirofilaria immitis]|nr:hypothetical protein [Dirofilaria immitis]
MIVATMIPAYMGEVKSDGGNHHLYFSYPTPVATNMVPANFTAYSMQIPPPYDATTVVNIAKHHEENFSTITSIPSTSSTIMSSASTSLSQQQQQQHQHQQQHQEQQQQQQQQRLHQRRSIVPINGLQIIVHHFDNDWQLKIISKTIISIDDDDDDDDDDNDDDYC